MPEPRFHPDLPDPAADLSGQAAAVLEAVPVAMVVRRLADDRILLANAAFRDLEGVDLGTASDREQEVRTTAGEPRLVQLQDIPLRPLGLLLTVVHDLTQVRHSQQALRASEQRTEEEIRRLAYYDALTGLPNRAFFLEQTERALANAHRTGCGVALLVCDLDDFKRINDTYGHELGDDLLRAIAHRLHSCTRRGDILSRPGGDEFALLVPRIDRDGEILAVANKIIEAMTRPFVVRDRELHAATSVGIAVYPDDGEATGDLLKHADLALYAAKAEGRNRFQFFNPEMHLRVQQRTRLEAGLRRALDRGELSLLWQPQFSLRTGGLVGVEALLRWHSGELGEVSPAHFIPLAEETGLIHEIGDWVLRNACLQAARWRQRGGDCPRVAVNISGKQFSEPGLVERVMTALREAGLEPGCLELEITEGVLMHDAEHAQNILMTLRQGGVKVAIDDFGTGYSSLLYLRNYPVDRIKIAREFITDITTCANDAAIAGTVIAMANSLDMRALAEGVETSAQAEYLRALGCHEVQGFHFARPLPREEFEALLE